MKRRRPFEDAAVRAVFEAYPARLRADLLGLRELIFDTARETEGVGALAETLKWGQPAYVPSKPRGDRAIVFSQGKKVPWDALGRCIVLALTYHLKPRRS